MSNIENDVLNYIANSGVETLSIGTNLLLNFLPEDTTGVDDNLVVIFTYATSANPYNTSDYDWKFQLRVRDTDYDLCRTRAVAYHTLLNNVGIYSSEGRRILFRPSQPPSFLEIDDSNRTIYVFNFTALTEGY